MDGSRFRRLHTTHHGPSAWHVILGLCIVLLAPPTLAGKPANDLKSALANLHTLQAKFSQISLDERGNVLQRSAGMLYLQKPGKFRWNYKEPFHQEVVTDGGKVWFFDADLEQLTVKRTNAAIGSTPALLLAGDDAALNDFVLQDQGTTDGMTWIRLLPKKEDSGFRYITVGLEQKRISGMELADHFGNLTRIYFQDVKTDIALDPALFRFKVPPGVDVYEDR